MHPLALVEGGAENATLVTELIVGLRERGLDVTRPVLAVLDGSKALRRAVLAVFDHPVLARCQLHKLRNVKDKLPGRLRPHVEARMRAAHHADFALGRPSPAGGAGPRAGQDPPRRGGQPARGDGGDADRAARGPATGHRRIRRLAAYPGRGVTFHVHAVAKGCPTWRQPARARQNPSRRKTR